MNRYRYTLIMHFGPKCANCGFDDIRALELDHIHSNGSHDRKEFGNNNAMFKYYSENLEKACEYLQVLCCNCNRIKTYEKDERTGNPPTIERGYIPITVTSTDLYKTRLVGNPFYNIV